MHRIGKIASRFPFGTASLQRNKLVAQAKIPDTSARSAPGLFIELSCFPGIHPFLSRLMNGKAPLVKEMGRKPALFSAALLTR